MSLAPRSLAALALCLALVPGFAQQPAPRPPLMPQAVEARYFQLQQDFSAAVGKYQKASEEARLANTKLELERPQKSFAPRYIELARQGHPRAARWCMDFVADTSALESERRELFLTCAAKILPHVLWVDGQQSKGAGTLVDYGVREYVRVLAAAGPLLGNEKALALCTELFDKAVVPESKAMALNTQSTILMAGRGRDDPLPPEVLELQRRLVKEFGETDTGKRAAGQLFRLEHLQIGMLAPDFATEDVEGVPFKLSDYRGKVVVLDFWGFW